MAWGLLHAGWQWTNLCQVIATYSSACGVCDGLFLIVRIARASLFATSICRALEPRLLRGCSLFGAKRHADESLGKQLVGEVDDVAQEQCRDGGGYAKAA